MNCHLDRTYRSNQSICKQVLTAAPSHHIVEYCRASEPVEMEMQFYRLLVAAKILSNCKKTLIVFATLEKYTLTLIKMGFLKNDLKNFNCLFLKKV